MKIGFHGAAQTVTGSKFLLDFGTYRLLLDCGLFQGGFDLHQRNWRPMAFAPHAVSDDDVAFTGERVHDARRHQLA